MLNDDPNPYQDWETELPRPHEKSVHYGLAVQFAQVCPSPGKFVAKDRHVMHLRIRMESIGGLEDLVGYVERTTRLSRQEAARVVADVLAYFSESTEQFVRRRHSELQAQALRNPEIFERIAVELVERRFASAALSARQIRRLVYG